MIGTEAASRRGGSAAIEFALVGPLFVLMLMGMVVYGGWFWIAQEVQTLAGEAARAAVAGLDPAEREDLARAAVVAGLHDQSGIDPDRLAVLVRTDAEAIQVRLRLDVSDHWLMDMTGLVPPPRATIERVAVLRVGGLP